MGVTVVVWPRRVADKVLFVFEFDYVAIRCSARVDTYVLLPSHTRRCSPSPRLASPAGRRRRHERGNQRPRNSVVAVPPAFSPVAAPVCSHSPAYTTHQHVTILESPGMPPSAPSAPGATTDAVGSTDTPSSDTGPPLPRSKKQRGKPRQLQAPGPALAATAVCSVVAIVTVKMIQRSFRRLRTRLEESERAKQELEATCVSSQARIDELVKSLEEKTKELGEGAAPGADERGAATVKVDGVASGA